MLKRSADLNNTYVVNGLPCKYMKMCFFCLNLHRVKIFFKSCKSENIKVISGNYFFFYLVFKRSADLDNMLAVIIHGNVW